MASRACAANRSGSPAAGIGGSWTTVTGSQADIFLPRIGGVRRRPVGGRRHRAPIGAEARPHGTVGTVSAAHKGAAGNGQKISA
ncbi:hypothetical protein GCM10022205_08820 [Spinactinospora alkalitolerans]